ncbi:zinc finger protein 184 [Mugil cephalus]|uniref:zinc finger protein 184 n=1 Tax=Mugil cephalus TaxID=48193 RepID=UPI001FB809AA|nr:zinc finger protein 184 [Mugil cephalus]
MDGVSWSAARSHESFRGSTATADTLSRLASFIARADTKQHVQNQRPSLPMYICQECGKGFPHAADLLQHQELKHTLPKPHRCPSCGQEFSLRSSLQLHKCDREPAPCELCRGISRLGSSPCPACAAQDSDPGSRMQPHVVDRSPYACAPCGRGFSQKQALLHHQQAGCSEPASPSDVADASSLPDESPPVSEGDSARSDCSDAPPGTSGRAVSVCRLCSRTFRSEAGLQRHVQGHHAEEGQDAKGGGSAGGDARNLNEDDNKRLKSNKKLLSCRSCDMVFRSTSQLYMHRKEKHSREKIVRREPRPVVSKRRRKGGTYPCQLCGKVFVHHLSLRAHYRRHTDSSFSSQSAPCATKDSTLSENAPNKVKPSLGDNNNTNTNKKAGRGRPRKFRRVFRKAGDAGRSGEVPERVEEAAAAAAAAAEREFPCPSCAEVFSLRQELREHVELHQSSVRTRQCSVCASDMDTCKWPSSKRQRLYHCVPCQQGFSALDPFLEHCQEHLRVRVEEDGLTEGYAHPAAKA